LLQARGRNQSSHRWVIIFISDLFINVEITISLFFYLRCDIEPLPLLHHHSSQDPVMMLIAITGCSKAHGENALDMAGGNVEVDFL